MPCKKLTAKLVRKNGMQWWVVACPWCDKNHWVKIGPYNVDPAKREIPDAAMPGIRRNCAGCGEYQTDRETIWFNRELTQKDAKMDKLKHHLICNGDTIASFVNDVDRDSCLAHFEDDFPDAEFTAEDDNEN